MTWQLDGALVARSRDVHFGPVAILDLGEGAEALPIWFDLEKAFAGIRRASGMHDRRHAEVRAEMLTELRRLHPERIQKWWNR